MFYYQTTPAPIPSWASVIARPLPHSQTLFTPTATHTTSDLLPLVAPAVPTWVVALANNPHAPGPGSFLPWGREALWRDYLHRLADLSPRLREAGVTGWVWDLEEYSSTPGNSGGAMGRGAWKEGVRLPERARQVVQALRSGHPTLRFGLMVAPWELPRFPGLRRWVRATGQAAPGTVLLLETYTVDVGKKRAPTAKELASALKCCEGLGVQVRQGYWERHRAAAKGSAWVYGGG